MAAAVLNYLYRHATSHTLIEAFSESRLQKGENRGYLSQIYGGLTDAVKDFAKGVFIGYAANRVAENFFDTSARNGPSHFLIERLVISPVIEGIVFRGIIQNGIYLTQALARNYVSKETMEESRAYKVLTSTSFRVVISHLFQTAMYFVLLNRKDRSTADAAANILNTLLMPMYSIGYEQTGSLINTITAQIGRNVIVYGLVTGFKK